MGIKEIMSVTVDLSSVMIPAKIYENANKVHLPPNSIAMGADKETTVLTATAYLNEIRRQQMELQQLADEIAELVDLALKPQDG